MLSYGKGSFITPRLGGATPSGNPYNSRELPYWHKRFYTCPFILSKDSKKLNTQNPPLLRSQNFAVKTLFTAVKFSLQSKIFHCTKNTFHRIENTYHSSQKCFHRIENMTAVKMVLIAVKIDLNAVKNKPIRGKHTK